MRWNPLHLVILCVALGALLCLLLRPGRPQLNQARSGPTASQPTPISPTPASNILPTDPGRGTPSTSATNLAPAPPVAAPAPLPPPTPFLLGSADAPPAMDPAIVLNNMRIVINQFGSRFNGNPVGTNPEITRALNGDNPGQVKFISPDRGLRINGRGELVDYWGTPFFFHQLSGTEMEIHSAGPDRIMFTADDLVTR